MKKNWSNAWGLIVPAVVAELFGMAQRASATENPIRIGFFNTQTGPLSGAGKVGLLTLQIWREE